MKFGKKGGMMMFGIGSVIGALIFGIVIGIVIMYAYQAGMLPF